VADAGAARLAADRHRVVFRRDDNPLELELKQLAALRDAYPALSNGASIVRYASGRVVVFSRIDALVKREYVAAFNAGTEPATVSFPTSTPATTWMPLLGATGATTTPVRTMTLTIRPLSALLLKAAADILVAPAEAPKLKVIGDPYTNLWQVGATVAGNTPVSVAFALKRGKRAWTRLAIDDTPPYRAFLDPAKFKRSEPVQLVAVERALDGSTATSGVTTFKVRPR